jgi:hypothetical protein
MGNPFDDVDAHDDYPDGSDNLDKSENPDPPVLVLPSDDEEINAAP